MDTLQRNLMAVDVIMDVYGDAGLRELSREVLIAGGAPRDILLGKTVRDVDVFIQTEKSASTLMRLIDYIQDNYNQIIMVGDEEEYYKRYSGNKIKAVMESSGLDIEEPERHVPLNFILLDHELQDVQDFIEKEFDIGICEAIFEDVGCISVSTNFIDDYNAKALVTKKSIKNKKHLDKLKEKYYDWRTDLTRHANKLMYDWVVIDFINGEGVEDYV